MGRRLFPVDLESYKPLREVVFETMREAIIKGSLAPGERLMEVQLAEELGVSRTPVREAIRKLELEGLVAMIPRKGAYVADYSIKDITEVFEIRAALESFAAGLACERATEQELDELRILADRVWEMAKNNDLKNIIQVDTDFHERIYQSSRNSRLIQMLSNLREQIHRFRSTSLASPGRLQDTLEEHKGLVEAIVERNMPLAQRLALEHVENAEDIFLESIIKAQKAKEI
ncbi:MAG: GntR family transcriptional regulator [Bacillota bacterium]